MPAAAAVLVAHRKYKRILRREAMSCDVVDCANAGANG